MSIIFLITPFSFLTHSLVDLILLAAVPAPVMVKLANGTLRVHRRSGFGIGRTIIPVVRNRAAVLAEPDLARLA